MIALKKIMITEERWISMNELELEFDDLLAKYCAFVNVISIAYNNYEEGKISKETYEKIYNYKLKDKPDVKRIIELSKILGKDI